MLKPLRFALVLFLISSACKNNEPEERVISTDFSASQTTILKGTTITFTDKSVGGATTWNWVFEGGDPSSSPLNIPSVTYDVVGIYDVVLTTSNGDNTDSEAKQDYIKVIGEAEANFSASASAVDAGGEITFTDTSVGFPTSWEWSFQGGTPSISTEQNPTITYNVPGVYDVTLKVLNSLSDNVVTKSGAVTVRAVVADFLLSASTIEANDHITFTDHSSGSPTTWEWSFPGGTPSTSNEQNPTVTYSTAGIYDATLKASNPFSDDETTKSLAVKVTGLVSQYKLGGNTNDSGILSLAGTANGAVLATDRNGNANAAYSFDGVNDYIQMPYNFLAKDLPLTISFWAKFDELLPSVLCTDSNLGLVSGVGVVISKSGPTVDHLAFNIGNGGELSVENRRTYITDFTLQTGQWYHIVAVVDTNLSVKAYVNGVSTSGSYSGEGNSYTNLGSYGTLGKTGHPTDHFKGSLDDFRIYNKVLSQQEITNIFAE